MKPQAQHFALPVSPTSRSCTWSSQGDPLADVLDWLGHYDFRGDAHSSTSTTTPLDNADDDTYDVPVFDARPCIAGSSNDRESAGPQVVRPSSYHGTKSGCGNDATHQNFHGSGMAQGSKTPSMARCATEPSIRCLADEDCRSDQHAAAGSRDYFLDEEAERWDQRQQRSGAVGRIVAYHRGQSPKEDMFLRGGGRHHIVLAGLRDGGQASRAGLKVGDRLVSIDGNKDLLGLQAEAVQEGLGAPVVLVFLGFVGMLEAEVRLTHVGQLCTISGRQDAVWGTDGAPLQLCEERVFNVSRAPLFLAVIRSRHNARHIEEGESAEEEQEEEESRDEGQEEDAEAVSSSQSSSPEEKIGRRDGMRAVRPAIHARQRQVTWRRTPGHSTSWTKHVLEAVPCFELQRSEAHCLVKHALRSIDNTAPPGEDHLPLRRSPEPFTSLLSV